MRLAFRTRSNERASRGFEHGRDRARCFLVRSADLAGQLGNPEYLRKAFALYCEFREIGFNR